MELPLAINSASKLGLAITVMVMQVDMMVVNETRNLGNEDLRVQLPPGNVRMLTPVPRLRGPEAAMITTTTVSPVAATGLHLGALLLGSSRVPRLHRQEGRAMVMEVILVAIKAWVLLPV